MSAESTKSNEMTLEDTIMAACEELKGKRRRVAFDNVCLLVRKQYPDCKFSDDEFQEGITKLFAKNMLIPGNKGKGSIKVVSTIKTVKHSTEPTNERLYKSIFCTLSDGNSADEQDLFDYVVTDVDITKYDFQMFIKHQVEDGHLEIDDEGKITVTDAGLVEYEYLTYKELSVFESPAKKRKKVLNVEKELLCSFCNKKTEEFVLVCHSCNQAAHPSCMEYSEQLAIKCKSYEWQCIDCKACFVCTDSGNADSMLFCDICDIGCHTFCLNPEVLELPTGSWVCVNCTQQNINHKFSHTCTFDWSTDDVSEFLKSVGFTQESSIFQTQEIDGKSLMLMRKEDVVRGLSLKLGPAIKLYNQYICKLQDGIKASQLLYST